MDNTPAKIIHADLGPLLWRGKQWTVAERVSL
jgi:hypothetical protein